MFPRKNSEPKKYINVNLQKLAAQKALAQKAQAQMAEAQRLFQKALAQRASAKKDLDLKRKQQQIAQKRNKKIQPQAVTSKTGKIIGTPEECNNYVRSYTQEKRKLDDFDKLIEQDKESRLKNPKLISAKIINDNVLLYNRIREELDKTRAIYKDVCPKNFRFNRSLNSRRKRSSKRSSKRSRDRKSVV